MQVDLAIDGVEDAYDFALFLKRGGTGMTSPDFS
jgi:hypothetical protein